MILPLLLFGPGLIGIAVFAITFFSGLFDRGSRARRIARVSGVVLTAPSFLLACLLLVLSFTIFKEPPSLNELQREFPAKKADLEKIIHMSDEDATFSRIAPTFVGLPYSARGMARFRDGDPKARLPKPRWDAYRALYSRNGVKLGVQRDDWGDAFIMVDSVGLLNRGHSSGYLYCRSAEFASDRRFEPCVLRTESGQRNYDPKTRDEGYSFKRITSNWYVFDEGPG